MHLYHEEHQFLKTLYYPKCDDSFVTTVKVQFTISTSLHWELLNERFFQGFEMRMQKVSERENM